ncbi:MAG: cytochrome c biogenesis protein CcsA [Candidatus Omnitrophica bacterium]|nr:cytochrome c biogenesis protein CcsA [Candidatus Omnitrophota bacterium]
MKKIFLTVLLILSSLFSLQSVSASQGLGDIPIQNHGRIKPFTAYARESLQFVSGKDHWRGQDAVSFLIVNLDHPGIFLELPLIRVDYLPLKKMLGLSADENYFSYAQLASIRAPLTALVQSSGEKRNKDNRPSALEQHAETLYQRIIMVEALSTGETITVIPAEGAWHSPFKAAGTQADAFKHLTHTVAVKSPEASTELAQWLASVDPLLEKGMGTRIKYESLYYQLQPFYYAWILYLIGFFCLLLAKPLTQSVGKTLIFGGFAFHTAGLLLRWVVLMRPPVANMYETMIFMDWVLMFTVGIFVVIKKRTAFLSSGTLVSALVMLYARLLPVDQSLDVLSPVLRSSYWLTVHVIVIISSYSLFAFAMAVSHRHLFLSTKMTPQEDQVSADTIYRLLQAGLIALGAGTILGGIWANEAWGRFWGWDPKETWAFITFLGYMAILHLRYSKKLDNFALAVSGILGFLLVLMTWYGVNFVLGRGMHSYGSGSGGLQWIIYFLIFEAVFLGIVFLKRKT